jgi:D-alanine--poly(phosphoribitol) ligase subunit 1
MPIDGYLSLSGGPAAPPCLLTSLGQVTEIYAGEPAVIDEHITVTYAELSGWVRRIADALAENGVSSGDRVAVTGTRCASVVAAMLAIVSAGATYVPLDPEYPVKRLEFMLADSAAKLLLYAGESPGFVTSVRCLPIPGRGDASATEAIVGHCQADLAIYVIYTSGSTGWPKGVAIPHSCLDNMVEWQRNHSVRRQMRTGQFAPLNFDVFFQEVLGTICGGGTLIIVPERLRADPFSLLTWLAEQRIERLFLPYLALHMVSVASETRDSLDDLVLAEINTAGEQLVCTPAIREFFGRLPDCRLSNHYGQSELAMVTSHILTGPSSAWPPLPPIGVPLPGCETFVEPVDPSRPEAGELLVAGLPLCLGYLNQEALNKERFVILPGGTTCFRTGDLVRIEGGVLHFAGRRDDEVKIRGTRVNLLEVEAWLLNEPGVVEAACVVIEAGAGAKTLRAAVTLEDGTPPLDTRAMQAKLTGVLPAVSVPLSVTVLGTRLPRTPSGKLDRAEVARRIAPGCV